MMLIMTYLTLSWYYNDYKSRYLTIIPRVRVGYEMVDGISCTT